MKNIKELQTLLQYPKNVVIVTHFKPDADALGSSLGLYWFLKRKGHNVKVITPSDYPTFLEWMPGNEEVLALKPNNKKVSEQANKTIENADIIFCLDFSRLSRINDVEESVGASKAVKVIIDHHLNPENFASYSIHDSSSASTAGLVYGLIKQMKETHHIDSNIATCLYAGLMTDTGSFRHSNTRSEEFIIAAELFKFGANPSLIAKLIYDTNTIERLRLIGYVLHEKLVIIPELHTAYMIITDDELRKLGSQTGDSEGIVNYGLSIEGIKLSVLLHEKKDEIKLSFRSTGDFSVNDLANQYFDGGGHKNAAGGTSKDTLENTLQKLLAILTKFAPQLKN